MSPSPDGLEIFEHLGNPVLIYDPDTFSVVRANAAARARCPDAVPEDPEGMSTIENPDLPFLARWKIRRDGETMTMPAMCRLLPSEDGRRRILVEPSVPSFLDGMVAQLATSRFGSDGMISMFAPDGTLLYANAAAHRFHSGRSDRLFDRFSEQDGVQQFLEAMASDGSASSTLQIACDGAAVWHEVSGCRCVDPLSGKMAVLICERPVQGSIAAPTHAGDYGMMEAPASHKQEMSLLAQVSHDMRSSIGGIIGLANIVRERMDDEALEPMLREIADYGTALEKLTDDVLDLSRIESGQCRLEAVPFLPIDLVKRIERVHAEAAQDSNTSFRVQTDLKVNSRRIGDPDRLLQILNNVVGNAIKFTKGGEVFLRMHCNDPRTLRIEVRDTGIGMTPDQLDRIFERFVQADASIYRRYGGSGLGMTIVKQLVQAMSGTIGIESQPDVGTTVSIELPIALSTDNTRTVTAQAAEMFKFDHNIRALIVDDVPTNQIVLESMLKLQEITADVAGSGAEAIEMVKSTQYDLLLIDIMMPGMDGTETLARIRDIDATLHRQSAPAIAVTAHALPSQVEGFIRSGFDAHVGKPVNIERLNICIERLMEKTLGRHRVAPPVLFGR